MTSQTIYWGVDSTDQVNETDDPRTSGQSVFDYVTAQAGGQPSFWGRYIGAAYALQPDEVPYLHARNCTVLLIYNGVMLGHTGGYSGAKQDANNAITAADALGAPAGTMIFADIGDPDYPDNLWYQGWCDVMVTSKYAGAGGFYVSTTNLQFSGQYCPAYNADSNVRLTYIWSTQPQLQCTSLADAPGFGPTPPPCGPAENTVLWQYYDQTSCFTALPNTNGVVDEDEATSAGYDVMW